MEEEFHKPKQNYWLTRTLQSPSTEWMIFLRETHSLAMCNLVLHVLLTPWSGKQYQNMDVQCSLFLAIHTIELCNKPHSL